MEKELTSILKNYNGTVIFVTHDIAESYRVCDDIIVFDKGLSSEKRNKNAFFNIPKSLSEAKLTGCRNISSAKRIDVNKIYSEDWGYEYLVKDDVPKDINYLCIRSHDIEISVNKNNENTYPFDYTVHLKNYRDVSRAIIEITLKKDNLNFSLNETIYLKFKPEDLFYF